MRTALYMRVSTKKQANDPQRTELVEFCRAKGWEVGPEFCDVISGAKAGRPGLDALMAGVKAKEFDAVLVVKIDRVARSLSHFARVLDELKTCGVALVVTSQGIDTTKDNPMNTVLLQILGMFAELERTLIRERVKAGIAESMANGTPWGNRSRKLVKNHAEVIALWRTETGGFGYKDLAKRLGGVSTSTAHELAVRQ